MSIMIGKGAIAARIFRKALFFGSASTILLASHAYAADRIFPLYIENAGLVPLTATISPDNSNCYEGDPPLGQVFHIQPGDKAKITLARVQGHGCNGSQGEFELVFDPPANGYTVQHFDYDNDGGLERSSGRANVYPGRLSPKSPKDGSYTYTSVKQVEITAGPAIGSWTLVCQSICSRTVSYTIINTNSTEKSQSKSVRNAITTSLESSLTFPEVGGIKGTIQTSEEKTIGEQMAQTVTHSENNTDTLNYSFSPEQMRSLGVFAVWQWIATVRLSDDSIAVVKSNKFTCTPGKDTPTYLPGSPEDVKACRGG